MNDQAKSSAPAWHWGIAILALLWNLMGCAAYATEMLAQESMMESMTDEQKEWVRSIPGWVYVVYAVAVTSGVAGSIGLLMREQWPSAAFAVCLVAVIVQMGYTMLIAGGLKAMGSSGAVMPSLVVVFAGAFLAYSRFARKQDWYAGASTAQSE